MPAEEFPGLLEQPLGGSLMEVLRDRYGVEPVRALERIAVVLASREEAEMLAVKIGPPLLSVEPTAWGTSGRVFELSIDGRGDRTRDHGDELLNPRGMHSEDREVVEVHST
jgi:GntR family transcriptional regulator